MTAIGGDRPRSSRVPPSTSKPSAAATLLIAIVLAACSSPANGYDREGLLTIMNAKEGDIFGVNVKDIDGKEIGQQDAGAAVRGVRLRFRGSDGYLKISVSVHHVTGEECVSVELEVKSKGDFELAVDVNDFGCAPMLPPDAGAPLLPDAGPDLQPDATPDLGPSPECQQYCTVMHDKCPSVYLSEAECHTTCQAFGWTEGAPGNAQNTLSCRIALAAKATQPDDPQFCRYAGPSGGNACGLICRDLCETTARVCPAQLTGGSLDSCYAAPCDPSKVGSIRAESGDTLDCRFHWLTVAAMDQGQSCARLTPEAPNWPCR
jgi:hypothetical protein